MAEHFKSKMDVPTLHEFLVTRIHHEDSMLSQRTYNFVTINTFLIAGLAITFTNPTEKMSNLVLPYIISIFGLLFSFFHLAVGRATERAITFWREYLRALEKMMGLKLDSSMFEFYRNGNVDTGFEIRIFNPEKPADFQSKKQAGSWIRHPLSWLPSSLNSTNIWVGVLIPWLAATLWLAMLIVLFCRAGATGMIYFSIPIFFAAFIVSWYFTPASPQAEQIISNENQNIGEIKVRRDI